ncbi:NADPH-dependent FMN reductase [Deinococcus marmoris]|uniref:Electron transport and membrane-associated energy conservation n=1 Tax=Deinococcus marmoris TaxID=249408 RepID=A0A1U7P0B5_9DEIO|nr:NADPH-dependent FMN reductase [Deinococcus marmoris]OLV18612.1 electron transport and membrane-associated energy conservation [Deinococcus marmoris]
MKFAVLSTSLDPESRSAWLCTLAARQLREAGHTVTHLDLRETPLPPFDNLTCYAHPNADLYHRTILEADGVLLGVPVYNWGLGSGARTLVELTGSSDAERNLHGAWFDKPVTFLVSGGLDHGYLSHGAFALGLMYDFRCVINPHFVYATSAHWDAPEVPGKWLAGRLARTVSRTIDLSERLRGREYQSVWEI